MRVNFYLPLWPFAVYLTTGLLLWLPLEWRAFNRLNSRQFQRFWPDLWRGVKKRPWTPLLVAVVWPLAIWESRRR